jgi:NADH-quinone oxidoreductase subunit H
MDITTIIFYGFSLVLVLSALKVITAKNPVHAALFLGGWLPPFDFLAFIPGWIWLGIKTFCVVTMFLWVRSTFPRFRYDQIMRLGWKIFIPVTLVWLVVVGAWMQTPYNIWK